MPIFIGDYIADTIGLTNAEHGAYLLALMKYWRKGESLTPVELKEVCGRETDRISRFFTMDGGRWHHKRVDQEMKTARDRNESARLKANKGVEARRQKGQI